MAPQVVVELKRPSLMRITQMMGTTGTVSFFLYFFVGMMGYLMFGNCVCNNISVSFGPNPWIAVAQAFVVCSVTAGYPTNVWPCRDAILELVYPHTCGKHKKWLVSTRTACLSTARCCLPSNVAAECSCSVATHPCHHECLAASSAD
jgi:amino acid permease